IIGACSKDDNISEWMRVANLTEKPVEFSMVTDRDQINKINQLTEGIKWQDRQIKTTDDSDFQFWLEHKGEDFRITNF
ncbi:hypothetical protein, partial [Paenibacillus gansuensis]